VRNESISVLNGELLGRTGIEHKKTGHKKNKPHGTSASLSFHRMQRVSIGRVSIPTNLIRVARVVKANDFMQANKMLLETYRDCTNYREILRIVQKSSYLPGNLIWQSRPSGKLVIEATHLEIDFVSRGIALTFDNQKYKLDPNLPLYVKLEHRSSVFKVTQFAEGINTLHFSFPETLKTMELRSERRFEFAEGQREIALKPSLNLLNSDSGNEIKVRLVDLSRSGAGLLISENNRMFIKKNKFLWLTEIDGHRMYDPILAEVVYAKSDDEGKIHRRKERALRVGLKLSSKVPKEIFSSLQ